MILDILLGLSLLAVLVLLRVMFLWGHAQGRLDEYNSIRPVPPNERYLSHGKQKFFQHDDKCHP